MSWSACSLEKTTGKCWATSWRLKPTRWALPIWDQAPAQGFCLLKSTFSLLQLLVWGQVLGLCDCNRSSLSKDERILFIRGFLPPGVDRSPFPSWWLAVDEQGNCSVLWTAPLPPAGAAVWRSVQGRQRTCGDHRLFLEAEFPLLQLNLAFKCLVQRKS